MSAGRRQVSADVVVVGGGGSGFAAAVEARSLGRSVILIEKNEAVGGTTARSVGSITATNTPHQLKRGILDCPEDHLADLIATNAKLGLETNLELSRLLVENVGETLRWLMSMGIEFYGPLAEGLHRRPRLHNVLPNSRAYIYHLAKRARRLGVAVHTRTRARQIMVADGRASGVLCDTPDGAVEFQARGGVVLATGDFGGNPEMVAKYIPSMAAVEPINPLNIGDGHQMALALGGRIVHPQLHQGGIRFQAPPEKWITALPPYIALTRAVNVAMDKVPGWLLRPFLMSFLTAILVPDANLYKSGALLINKHGQRFADELNDPARNLAQQPDKLAYILLDGALVEKFSRAPHHVSTAPGVAYAFIPDYRRSRKDIFNEGRTLGELAARLGIAAGALERSIADYNASPDKAGRPPLDRGPYVALGPVRHFIQFTDSGMAVDGRLRVLGANDTPIEGLFAAGFVGMGGALLWGHGHHLGWAFTSGRFAGRHAANRALSQDLRKQPA